MSDDTNWGDEKDEKIIAFIQESDYMNETVSSIVPKAIPPSSNQDEHLPSLPKRARLDEDAAPHDDDVGHNPTELKVELLAMKQKLGEAVSLNTDLKNKNSQLIKPKRGGISFLSGDAMKIGLIGKKGGLSSVVRALQQKKLEKKVGTLEKSRLDWQSFKKAEGIEDELRTAVKSKNGYMERQEFLQRTDLREFEIEKNLRAKRRRLTEN